MSFGNDSQSRSWEDARRYGFVSAGGGDWYSKTLKTLPEGARVCVHVPQRGYVGVGIVQGPAVPADEAVLTVDGREQEFRTLTLDGTYSHPEAAEGVDAAEYIVPVRWVRSRPLQEAHWRLGMYANQNSACKLRNQFTIEELIRAFGIAG